MYYSFIKCEGVWSGTKVPIFAHAGYISHLVYIEHVLFGAFCALLLHCYDLTVCMCWARSLIYN